MSETRKRYVLAYSLKKNYFIKEKQNNTNNKKNDNKMEIILSIYFFSCSLKYGITFFPNISILLK